MHPTWVAREVLDLAARSIGRELTEEARGWEAIEAVPEPEIWAVRRTLRGQLVAEARRRLRESWLQRGAHPSELAWVDEALDPDVLTIGFARRVPSYKRLTLMMRDAERLKGLLLHPTRPIQIVVAGKSHPADDGGKRLIQELVKFSDDPAVRHRIVFLPDYDMAMARPLYPGCDVWLNNPLRPLEACGTSGMKAALNGCLNLSILDGWWDEMYDGKNGWAIPTADDVTDPDRRDDLEAAALYDLIEQEVAERFYDREPDGLPHRWLQMVRHTLRTVGPKVLASRMVHDYVVDLYTPAAAASRTVDGPGYVQARELAAWKERVHKSWPAVRVEHVEPGGLGATPELGESFDLRATVNLGDLSPDDVRVELLYGSVDDEDLLVAPERVLLTLAGPASHGSARYLGSVPLERAGAFGYTVRVVPAHPLLANDAELNLVALPPTAGAGVDFSAGDLDALR